MKVFLEESNVRLVVRPQHHVGSQPMPKPCGPQASQRASGTANASRRKKLQIKALLIFQENVWMEPGSNGNISGMAAVVY